MTTSLTTATTRTAMPSPDLLRLLRELNLGKLARVPSLDYAAFLQILLADEVSRRAQARLDSRVLQAVFEEVCRLEAFDWTAQIRLDRRLLQASSWRRVALARTVRAGGRPGGTARRATPRSTRLSSSRRPRATSARSRRPSSRPSGSQAERSTTATTHSRGSSRRSP